MALLEIITQSLDGQNCYIDLDRLVLVIKSSLRKENGPLLGDDDHAVLCNSAKPFV